MRDLIERLCAPECNGRAPGTPGGRRARGIVRAALEAAGLEPYEQPIPDAGGANVLASLRGRGDRWIVVAAHFDHLGEIDGEVYPGADDNAAAVAILVEVARRIAEGPQLERSVLFAAFDAEEPPHFLGGTMGSEHFAREGTLPMSAIDLMICMDLVGHPVGGPDAPDAVRDTLFVLGAEKAEPAQRAVDDLARAEPGLTVHRLDAETIPPMSDYWAFWTRGVPFAFLTGGQWEHYHRPTDTPDRLDDARLAQVANWLERLVRRVGASPVPRFAYRGLRDDRSTLRTARELCRALRPVDPQAEMGIELATELLGSCDPAGRLPDGLRPQMLYLTGRIHAALRGEG